MYVCTYVHTYICIVKTALPNLISIFVFLGARGVRRGGVSFSLDGHGSPRLVNYISSWHQFVIFNNHDVESGGKYSREHFENKTENEK